eukprot:04766.XXX_71712_71936_1 [CDS] Oithona nana genome sequencing.
MSRIGFLKFTVFQCKVYFFLNLQHCQTSSSIEDEFQVNIKISFTFKLQKLTDGRPQKKCTSIDDFSATIVAIFP